MFTNEQNGIFTHSVCLLVCSTVCVGFLWNRVYWYFINEGTWKLASSTEHFLFWSRSSSLFFLVLWDLESCAKVLICGKRFYFLRQKGMQAIKISLFPNNPLYYSQALVCENLKICRNFHIIFPRGHLVVSAAHQQLASRWRCRVTRWQISFGTMAGCISCMHIF